MAPKISRHSQLLLQRREIYDKLLIKDVICPICRSILVEPVSLPCNHGFCFFCFENTMENANMVCPLCRLRVGSWLRKSKKENTLINTELWKIIREKFPQHVKNKLNGVDENLIIDDQRDIIVAFPGEIRKEYEIQKQKEDEEQRKIREAEFKASEELINQLKAEEESQKNLLDEKMKLDEALAKKLAKQREPKQESTSRLRKSSKKLGPLDTFVEKTKANQNSFINKEYTCRVLCLDTKSPKEKNFSPKIHKRMQQIQKLVDMDLANDSSDCIDSELRYFKPIDHSVKVPSKAISPIKITPRKLCNNTTANVTSPSGVVNFNSNALESAFARFSLDLNQSPTLTNCPSTPLTTKRPSIKRSLYTDDSDQSAEKRLKTETIDLTNDSPNLNCGLSPTIRKKLFNGVEGAEKSVESPPFYGFGKAETKETNKTRSNGGFDNKSFNDKLKEEQERADLEFAKRLQDEFDRGRYMRSSRSNGVTKRQSTIENMMKSRHKIK